jgi:hypothetical protein
MPDKSSLPGRVFEKLRDWVADHIAQGLLSAGGVAVSGILAALAKWLVGLSVLQRGVLWGAAGLLFLESLLFFLAGIALYLRRRAEASEVTDLVAGTKYVIRETSWICGHFAPGTAPAASVGHTIRDVREAIRRVQSLLVQAKNFRNRQKLFEAIKHREEELLETNKPDWENIKPHIDRLQEWVEFADRKLLLKSLPPSDPLDQPLP